MISGTTASDRQTFILEPRHVKCNFNVFQDDLIALSREGTESRSRLRKPDGLGAFLVASVEKNRDLNSAPLGATQRKIFASMPILYQNFAGVACIGLFIRLGYLVVIIQTA